MQNKLELLAGVLNEEINLMSKKTLGRRPVKKNPQIKDSFKPIIGGIFCKEVNNLEDFVYQAF